MSVRLIVAAVSGSVEFVWGGEVRVGGGGRGPASCASLGELCVARGLCQSAVARGKVK